MQVMQGWSGEVQSNRWAKVDVTVNEVDILRILVEENIDLAPERVPTRLAYQLLDCEAERFVCAKLARSHGIGDARTRLGHIADARAAIVEKLRALADG